MGPEPTGWPAIDRLLARLLTTNVPHGVLEQKRLEHVLAVARVPKEAYAFERWMEEDRERLARLVTAVVGMAPAHRKRVEQEVVQWWAEECTRRRRGAEAGEKSGEPGGTSGAVGRRRTQARLPWWSSRRWWGLGVLVVVLVVAAWWSSRRPGEDDGPTTATGEAANGQGGVTDEKASEEAEASSGDSQDDVLAQPEVEETTGMPKEVLDLSDLSVRVPVATIEVVPGEPVVPWQPIAIAALALLSLVGLWRVKAPMAEPGPPIDLPRPADPPRATPAGRVLPRGRPLRKVVLDRGDRSALVSGNAREPDGRVTERIDVPRSIDQTIATQVPTLCFLSGTEHRGVWIWCDTDMEEHRELASRLRKELESTLREAGLPVRVATFDGVPGLLKAGRERFPVGSLLGVGRTPRVVVLTDGDQLHRNLRSGDTQASTEGVLRLLRRWDGLALVDFGGPRSALAVLARDYHLPRITPEQAAMHLAGEVPREGPVVWSTRDLLSWEAACAVAPRAVTEDDAQRLRLALRLEASAFDIGALRARAGVSGRSRLRWSAEDRADVLARYDRGYGYLEAWPTGGAELLRKALEFWRGVYDEAIAARTREGEEQDTDAVAYLQVERAVLGLWERSEVVAATRTLYEHWQSDALREAVTELVSHHADAAGSVERVRLPWSFAALQGSTDEGERDAAWMLAQMGFVRTEAVERALVPVRRGGRRTLGLGILLGVMVTAVALSVMDARRTQMEVAMVGKAPGDATVGCKVVNEEGGQKVRCEVETRHPSLRPVLETRVFEEGEGAQRVKVSWGMQAQACEGDLARGARYVVCDREGRLRRREDGRTEQSRAVVMMAEGRELAQELLDSGSVDVVIVGAAGSLKTEAVTRVLGGAGQRLVVIGEGVDVEGVEVEGVGGEAVVVRVMERRAPSLAFVGPRTVSEAWQGVEVVRGDAGAFELVGTVEPSCPEGTRYVAGGPFGGQRVESFCLDTTEVTVAGYEACVKRGECSAAGSAGYCNTGRAERSEHPINCVDWEQAKAFCEGSKGRLPTSEEWEWAARGRESGWTYPWGNEPEPSCERVVMDESASMDDKRWGCDTGATWPVGSKPKGDSLDGVKDLAGNVSEWTSTVAGEERIVRGGSWGGGIPEVFRASARFTLLPSYRFVSVGFRCARTSVSTP